MTLTAFAPLPVVEYYREIVEDRAFPTVREWRRRTGRKVAGSFPVYSPVELGHAAGMLPVGLFGGGNQIEIAHADSRFQSFICSIVKSTLELGFVDKLAPFDALLFHSICDPARNLASVMARNFPERRSIYVHLAQNMTSAGAAGYLAYEYRRVAAELGEVSGHMATDDELRASIAAFNAVRARLRELYALRAASPEKLSTAELYTLVRMSTFTDPVEAEPLLAESLEAATGRDARPKDRIRVVVVGSFCEQPPLELIAGLEEAGCYILDDDFLLGWRLFRRDVPTEGDPFRALAVAYIDDSLHASTKHDLRVPRAKAIIDSARALGADAAICLIAKFCEPGLFDYALYRKAFEVEGIPHLYLEFEEKMWLYDKIRTEVETFVESMLFA
jgi:benzoyl-CoA reductase subunit C